MEVGDPFLFATIRRNKVDRQIPAHPEHIIPTVTKKEITRLVSMSQVLSKEAVNSGGMVILMQYLLKGFQVRNWSTRGLHTQVRLVKSGTQVLWFI